ncbi:MAG TPA: hypothetical protein VEG25_08730 [Burkholderiales bacterium]|nr:hypothetical protein [Burkholderiales bacterium]
MSAPDIKMRDDTVYEEVQVLLSEKRTSLSMLRTGIAVFALPLSVLSVLVATSAYYTVSEAASFLYPLLALSVVLVVLGAYLCVHAIVQIRRYDRQIAKIGEKHAAVAEFIG